MARHAPGAPRQARGSATTRPRRFPAMKSRTVNCVISSMRIGGSRPCRSLLSQTHRRVRGCDNCRHSSRPAPTRQAGNHPPRRERAIRGHCRDSWTRSLRALDLGRFATARQPPAARRDARRPRRSCRDASNSRPTPLILSRDSASQRSTPAVRAIFDAPGWTRRVFLSALTDRGQNQVSTKFPTASTTYATMATQNPYVVTNGIAVKTPMTAITAMISETINSHCAGAWSFMISPFPPARWPALIRWIAPQSAGHDV